MHGIFEGVGLYFFSTKSLQRLIQFALQMCDFLKFSIAFKHAVDTLIFVCVFNYYFNHNFWSLQCYVHYVRFYARQLYRQVLLRARISYGDSVCPSVCHDPVPNQAHVR